MMLLLLSAIAIPLIVLVWIGGLVGGIWLLILADWAPVVRGIGALITSIAFIHFHLAPRNVLVSPLTAALERGSFVLAWVLGTLSSLWTLAVMTLWCVGCFWLIVFVEHKSGSIWPYFLWAYSIAAGPWGYLASRRETDANSATWALFACLGIIAMIAVVLFSGEPSLLQLSITFSAVLVPALLIQTALLISMLREESNKPINQAIRKLRDLE
jgi:hypothetical protein